MTAVLGVPHRHLAALALTTLAFLLGCVAFSLAIPLFQSPDEPAHVDMVRHYADRPGDRPGPDLRIRRSVALAERQVPFRPTPGYVAWDGAPEERPAYPALSDFPRGAEPSQHQNYHFAHPPAYYLLLAPVSRVLEGLPFPKQVLGLRLAGVVMAAPMVPLAWYAASVVWGRSSLRPLAVAGLVASAGPLAAAVAGVNNDALVLPLAAAMVALMATLLARGSSVRRALGLGCVVALGLLTKGQFLPLAPVALAAVVAAPGSWRARLESLGAFLAVMLAGSAWWLSSFFKDGSWRPAGSELVLPEVVGPWEPKGLLEYAAGTAGFLMRRFFGSYGWRYNVVVPGLVGLIAAAVLIGLVALWLVAAKGRPLRGVRWRVGLLAAVPAALFVAVLYSSWELYRESGFVGQGIQGRYLYGGLPVVAMGVVGLVGAIGRRWLSAAAACAWLGVGLAVAAVVGMADSFLVAITGLYGTTSIDLLVSRLAVTAPMEQQGLLLAVVVAWALAVLGAALAVATPERRRRARPMPDEATVTSASPSTAPREAPPPGPVARRRTVPASVGAEDYAGGSRSTTVFVSR